MAEKRYGIQVTKDPDGWARLPALMEPVSLAETTDLQAVVLQGVMSEGDRSRTGTAVRIPMSTKSALLLLGLLEAWRREYQLPMPDLPTRPTGHAD